MNGLDEYLYSNTSAGREEYAEQYEETEVKRIAMEDWILTQAKEDYYKEKYND